MKIQITESQYHKLISEIKYSDDEIRQEASKYNSQNEFMKGSPKLFYGAFNRNMLDDLFPDRQRGKGRTIKYSDDDIRQEASKYNSRTDFQKNSPSLYQLALKRGLLDDLFPDRKIGSGRTLKYSDDEIRQEALKYNSQNEFIKNSPSLYQLARKRGLLDDLFPDRQRGKGRTIKYSDDEIRQEASKYNSQNEFMKKNINLFTLARRRNMLDDLFPDRKRGSGGQNKKPDDEIRQEASKYNSQNEFRKGNRRMFDLAWKRGMLDDLFPGRKIGGGRTLKYSDDEIRQEALKYNSQNEFIKNSPSLYQLALKRGLLDDLFPGRKIGGGRTLKYSDDEIRQEALKYNSQNEFIKNSPSLYQLARKRGLLDDLFPDRKKRQNESINKIHKMMGIITEERMSKVIKNLMDKYGLIHTIETVGYDNLKKYVDDDTIKNQDKKEFIELFKSYVQDYFNIEEPEFGGQQPQGSEGVPLDDEMIHLPENSDDEYDEYITHIGEDGVLVTVFHNGNFEDDYNIWWKVMPLDIYFKIFEFLNK
jgi:hypothetical protein